MNRVFLRLELLIALLVVNGCSDSGTDDPGWGGQPIEQGVIGSAKPADTKVDAEVQIDVEVSKPLADAGLISASAIQPTRFEGAQEKTISIFLMAREPLATSLTVAAHNSLDQEIGRATLDVDLNSPNSVKVSRVTFATEMDMNAVKRYKIDLAATLNIPETEK